MPDLLTTRQLAEYLQLSERTIYRLLERGEIPALKVGGQWRFRKSAVDEWLDLQMGRMDAAGLDELGHAPVSVSGLLSRENIFLGLPAGSPREVLGALVERLALPEPVDRAMLLARLLEREALCSTALEDGVAIPHTPRTRPRMLHGHDVVAIGRTAAPVEFGALDGRPTNVFVLVLARDERAHLTLLAKVTRLVREADVHDVLLSAQAPDEIVRAVARSEARLFGRGSGRATGSGKTHGPAGVDLRRS
ncbi:MAG: PTS sugar transporter subunit IIA [Gemmatimonadetes bacterium]|nr:PTS sugar transporter subunit IIA [Gemmatimonadota bacterium]